MLLSPAFSTGRTRPQGMKLSLELIIASLADRSSLRYFVMRQDISSGEQDPDALVLELLDSPQHGIPSIARKNCFVHSTSWRYEPRQTVVLTYFVYSDLHSFRKNPGRLLRLQDAAIPASSDPTRPRPAHIAEEHVVAHGIRHLSHLVKDNSQNVRSILAPQSIQILQEMESRLAGRLC